MTLLFLVAAGPAAGAPPPCPDAVPVFASGRTIGEICAAQARSAGLVVVDLGGGFAPGVLRGTSYLPTLADLAADRGASLELYGIFPDLPVHRGRLTDEARHACHQAVDDAPLAAYLGTLRRDHATRQPERSSAGRRAAISAIQAHLVCERMLDASEASGGFGPATAKSLAAYRLRHLVPGTAVVDEPLREILLAGSRELDFRALLRALRERVVDATGIIEDGSARAEWGTVLGRHLDPAPLRDAAGYPPLANGAADLVSTATEAAARALGWTDPAAAATALERAPARAALRLPTVPAYHSPAMELRAEIDRGDVWYDYPWSAQGRRAQPRERRPILVVYAQTPDGEIALLRWPTTIGGWQREKLPSGAVVMRYKESKPGEYVWNEVVAAPVWFAPPTTPDRELVRRIGDHWVPREEAIGPGYGCAYGLAMVMHRTPEGADTGVRTHGTPSYLSLRGGEGSHGCHRLYTHLALRLATFLIAHRPHVLLGEVPEAYSRRVRHGGLRTVIRRETRGYSRVLDPPVAVRILEGRIVSRRKQPYQRSFPLP